MEEEKKARTKGGSKWAIEPFEKVLGEPLRNGIYKKKEFHGRGAKIVNMGEIFAYSRLQNVEMQRVELTEKEENVATLASGDLLFARRSLTAEGAGKCSIVLEVPETTTFESSIIRARLNRDKANPEFYYYLFNSEIGRYLLGTILRQVAVSGITGGDLAKLKVPVPPISEQNEIVKRVSILDDKIELNHKMNQTLESMAQAIFKSWFVDFDPVKAKQAAKALSRDPERAAMAALSGKLRVPKNPADLSVEDLTKAEAELDQLGEEEREQLERTAALFPDGFVESELGLIPEGWEIVSFADLAVLDTTSVKPYEAPHNVWEHYSIPAYDEHQLPAFEEGTEIKSNKYLVRSQAVLSSKLNPQFPRTWWPIVFDAEAAICSTEFMQFIPILATDRAFIYCMVISNSFQAGISQRVSGSTGSRQRAKPKEVATMKVIDPGKDLRAVFSKKTLPMIEKAKQGFVQSKVLTQLRDTLLPKLLSGEISLCETEVRPEGAIPTQPRATPWVVVGRRSSAITKHLSLTP